LDSFFIGPGKTVLAKDEILKEILIPQVSAGSLWAYLKLGRRKSMDLALSSVAALLTIDSRKKTCLRARLALGAVAPTPLRAKETEKFLEGKMLDEEVIREAGERAQKECRPISDVRASAEYRKEIVKVLVERAIKQSLGIPIPPTGI
jgi:carbon-monoxide dehydrogenase medium subunit